MYVVQLARKNLGEPQGMPTPEEEKVNITFRNLLGGLAGGTIGSYLLYLAHPAWAFPGMVLGVVLGCWFDKIPQKFSAGWSYATKAETWKGAAAKEPLAVPVWFILEMLEDLGLLLVGLGFYVESLTGGLGDIP